MKTHSTHLTFHLSVTKALTTFALSVVIVLMLLSMFRAYERSVLQANIILPIRPAIETKAEVIPEFHLPVIVVTGRNLSGKVQEGKFLKSTSLPVFHLPEVVVTAKRNIQKTEANPQPVKNKATSKLNVVMPAVSAFLFPGSTDYSDEMLYAEELMAKP
jgi:hypothetical protein